MINTIFIVFPVYTESLSIPVLCIPIQCHKYYKYNIYYIYYIYNNARERRNDQLM